jgi:hypothetical protein
MTTVVQVGSLFGNNKIINSINKIKDVTNLVFPVNPLIGYYGVIRESYDARKIVMIIDGIRERRNERIAREIEKIMISGKGFDRVVKILETAIVMDPKLELNKVIEILPGTIVQTFLPKLSPYFNIADKALGLSKKLSKVLSPDPKSGTTGSLSYAFNKLGNKDSSNPLSKYFNKTEALDKFKINNPKETFDPYNSELRDPITGKFKEFIFTDGDPSKGIDPDSGVDPSLIDSDNFETKTQSEFESELGDLESLSDYSEIHPQSFEGYFGSNLGAMEFASTHLWDIQIKPYTKGVPELRPRGIKVLPISNWSLSEGTTGSESIDMFGGSNISIPTTSRKEVRMDVTFVEDSGFSIKSWLGKYKDFMFPNGKVRPYKNCCSKIGVWLIDLQRKTLYYQCYLGYPVDMSSDLEGELNPSPINKTVSFAIVGMLDNEPFYEQLKKSAPKVLSNDDDNKDYNQSDVDFNKVKKVFGNTNTKTKSVNRKKRK